MLLCSDGLSGMVRFDEIREIMRTAGEPIDICKALTERANLAGGHDNITVIIVAFDGPGLAGGDSGGDPVEPLKYRKYNLPEEDPDGSGSHATSSDASTLAPGTLSVQSAPELAGGAAEEGPSSAAKSRPEGRHEVTAGASPAIHDEGIDIPGTHVPAGVVVGIVIAVVAALAATAFILLR